MDHREQIVLQSARNAQPNSVNIRAYRFRHVADRLAQRGYLTVTANLPEGASYMLTAAGEGKLNTFRKPNPAVDAPAIAAE